MSRKSRLTLLLCAFSLTGCQPYRREPLDLRSHQAFVAARDVSSAEVVTYARQLGRASPARYDPADGLSLEEGEVVALFFNPALRTARLRARMPAVGAAEAGRWEDPELRVDAERIIESVEHPWVVGGMLGLTLPLSGRLGAEKDKAHAEADVEALRVVVAEQRQVADLRASWLKWSATSEHAALLRSLLTELDAIIESAEKLRAAGELDTLDARLFRIERLTQAGKLLSLEADARGEELDLKSKLGLAPAADVKLVPSLHFATQSEPAGVPGSLAEQHPRVLLARAEYEVAERTLRLELRRQYPDLALGGGFGVDEGDERVLGGLGLPLPLWNRNRRAIAEARAAREAARAAAEGEYEQLESELAKSRAAFEAALSRLKFVETGLAPLVDEQLQHARRLGKLGNYNTLVLLEALTAAFDAKSEVVEARLKLGLAAAGLRTLTGTAAANGDGNGKDQR